MDVFFESYSFHVFSESKNETMIQYELAKISNKVKQNIKLPWFFLATFVGVNLLYYPNDINLSDN